MASVYINESFTGNDTIIEEAVAKETDIKSDVFESVQKTKDCEVYQALEKSKTNQEVDTKRFKVISQKKMLYVFLIFLSAAVIGTLIGVIILFASTAKTDGSWGSWQMWGNCSVECGGGFRTRSRTCSKPTPSPFGRFCQGNSIDIESCESKNCDGSWGSWQMWGNCSAECGGGFRTRSRTCSKPTPSPFGRSCQGNSIDIESCESKHCDGSWDSWQMWSNCSADCGAGFRTRSRTCTNPTKSPFGRYCPGHSIDIESCVNETCEICQSRPCHAGICRSKGDNFYCACLPGYTGRYCENILSDCIDILHYGGDRDGIYTIRTWRHQQLIKVYCDMTTDGGGWTVFQYRFNGSVDFNRGFSQYEERFGNLKTEFWLGLRYIEELASQGRTDLRIDLEAADGTTGFEKFDRFSLSAGPAYTLHIGSTIASSGISNVQRVGPYHNGMHFSTYDHDADTYSGNCAVKFYGGWWYKNCFVANLNGEYFTPGTNNAQSMCYYSFLGLGQISLKSSKMMMRRTFTSY